MGASTYDVRIHGATYRSNVYDPFIFVCVKELVQLGEKPLDLQAVLYWVTILSCADCNSPSAVLRPGLQQDPQ